MQWLRRNRNAISRYSCLQIWAKDYEATASNFRGPFKIFKIENGNILFPHWELKRYLVGSDVHTLPLSHSGQVGPEQKRLMTYTTTFGHEGMHKLLFETFKKRYRLRKTKLSNMNCFGRLKELGRGPLGGGQDVWTVFSVQLNRFFASLPKCDLTIRDTWWYPSGLSGSQILTRLPVSRPRPCEVAQLDRRFKKGTYFFVQRLRIASE